MPSSNESGPRFHCMMSTVVFWLVVSAVLSAHIPLESVQACPQLLSWPTTSLTLGLENSGTWNLCKLWVCTEWLDTWGCNRRTLLPTLGGEGQWVWLWQYITILTFCTLTFCEGPWISICVLHHSFILKCPRFYIISVMAANDLVTWSQGINRNDIELGFQECSGS